MGAALSSAQDPAGGRYRIQFEGVDQPPFFESDALRTLSNLQGTGGAAFPAIGAGSSSTEAASSALPRVERTASRVATDGSRPMGIETLGNGLIDPGSSPGPTGPTSAPTQAFRDRLRDVYLITDPDDVQAIWDRFNSEADQVGTQTIGEAERTGNAVVRYSLGQGQASPPRTVGDADFARMQAMTGQSGPATLRVSTPVGVGIRSLPWGSSQGSLGQGAPVEVELPPDSGGWVRVVGGGYVNALWLEP